MNALNDLTAEVRFRERMRGYDFEEVDNYVKTVSRAAAQASEQISELQQRLAHTESHSDNADGVRETREMLLRTLVLAQRTADAAVSEARSEARSITDSAQDRASKTVAEAEAAANERLRSSEERAAHTLAEAEENSQLILAETKRTAAAELAAERSRKIEEIQTLEATRAELEAATSSIQTRLQNERTQLRSLAISFQSFVEQFEPVPDAGEPGEQPPASVDSAQRIEVDVSPVTGERGPAAEPASLGEPDVAGEAALEFPPDSDTESRTAAEDSDTESRTAAEDSDTESPTAAEDPDTESPTAENSENARALEDALADTLAMDTLSADTLPDLPPAQWYDDTTDAPSDPAHATGSGASGPVSRPADPQPSGTEPAAAPAMHAAEPDSPELFDIEAEDDDEFIEQLRRVVSSDAPLSNADAAMAAFFDHDERADRGGRLGYRA